MFRSELIRRLALGLMVAGQASLLPAQSLVARLPLAAAAAFLPVTASAEQDLGTTSAGVEADLGMATSQAAGTIQDLDLGAETLVIDGLRYQMAVGAKVEIGGSYGAFTMLEEGMRVYFEYRRESSTSRLITLMRELPDDVVLDES